MWRWVKKGKREKKKIILMPPHSCFKKGENVMIIFY
jgi:hypothetical protein